MTETFEMDYDQKRDYEAFLEQLPALLDDHQGEVVVIHNSEVIRFFGSIVDAVRYGANTYGAGMFIAQEVVDDNPEIVSYSLDV